MRMSIVQTDCFKVLLKHLGRVSRMQLAGVQSLGGLFTPSN